MVSINLSCIYNPWCPSSVCHFCSLPNVYKLSSCIHNPCLSSSVYNPWKKKKKILFLINFLKQKMVFINILTWLCLCSFIYWNGLTGWYINNHHFFFSVAVSCQESMRGGVGNKGFSFYGFYTWQRIKNGLAETLY